MSIWRKALCRRQSPKVIVSGGANEGIISEARGMEFALRNLGVPADAIIREDHIKLLEKTPYTQNHG